MVVVTDGDESSVALTNENIALNRSLLTDSGCLGESLVACKLYWFVLYYFFVWYSLK